MPLPTPNVLQVPAILVSVGYYEEKPMMDISLQNGLNIIEE